LRHINISLLWVQEQEKLKKLVYEKVPGQDNPADLFTKGVGREKLQQFAWASGQIFLDGRAEAGLQVQGIGLSTVGIGSVYSTCKGEGSRGSHSRADTVCLWKSGSLCASSGSDNSVNPASKQRTPNAADTKKIQYKSKNSELARVTVIGGRLKCITEKYIPHYTRPIGSASTSDARPDWWCYPRRKCRGEVSGNMHTLAHAQFGSWACHYFRRCLTSQNEVRGDVPISVPAPCGSWRDAHLSAHAKYWSWSNIGVRQSDQLERWGQCNLRYPSNAKLNRERPSQGGVVEPNGQVWLGRGRWASQPAPCVRECCSTSVVCKIESV